MISPTKYARYQMYKIDDFVKLHELLLFILPDVSCHIREYNNIYKNRFKNPGIHQPQMHVKSKALIGFKFKRYFAVFEDFSR